MKEEIKIPQMGESITEASIAAILKPSGSLVEEGDEIIELETEKVNQVLYAPARGMLSLTVTEGEVVHIGDQIGFIDKKGEPEAPEAKIRNAESKEPSHVEKEQQLSKSTPEKLEEEQLEKAGVGKRVMREAFVEELKSSTQSIQFQAGKQEEKPRRDGVSRRKMSKLRQTIAKRLVDSLHSAAMLTTFNEVDMSAIIALREKYREIFPEKHGVKLGFMSFFVKAVVEALKIFPDFNSFLENDEIVTYTSYDIGIAVGTERGLVVPVIRGCDSLTFSQIEKEIARFAKKAREGKLEISDLEGGGFTITNGGIYGSMLSTPILNPPQVGILGMHKIMKRPVVVDEEILIRPMMYLALSYDHRVVDGKEAVSFLVHIKEVLEDPSSLLFIGSDGNI